MRASAGASARWPSGVAYGARTATARSCGAGCDAAASGLRSGRRVEGRRGGARDGTGRTRSVLVVPVCDWVAKGDEGGK